MATNTTNINYPRGSEWHIWDLHVHTPASIVNYYVPGDDCDIWENFIRDLESLPDEVKVLGINDYLFIDGYKKVLEYKNNGRLQNIDLILPVVEFRLAQFGGNRQFSRVNFHVIFSNKLDADIIQCQFLNALSTKYQLSPEYNSLSWGGLITIDNLQNLGRQIIDSVPKNERIHYGSELVEGFNNLNFNYREIMSILESAPQFFEGQYLTAIGKTEWEDIKWNDHSIAEKKNIINSVDFVFTAAETVDAYFAGLEKLTNAGVNNRLLDCSDAHYNSSSDNKDRIGNCHCWIKAETTFEGLRQVLYEPSERKTVSLMYPRSKNTYQIIDHVILDEEGFWQDVVPLNPDLNTIIGGRATGKSTLLKAMAAKQANVKLKEDDSFVKQHLDGVKVIWADGEEHPENQIDFFRQSYMHDLAEKEDEFNDVLSGIISDKDEQHILSTYDTSNSTLKAQLAHDILAIFQNHAKILSFEEKIRNKGNKSGILGEIEKLKVKLQELSKSSSISEEELNQYQNLSEQISQKEALIAKADRDIAILEKATGMSIVNHEYLRLTGLNGLEYIKNQSMVQDKFNSLSTSIDNEWTAFIQQILNETKQAIINLNKDISQIKSSELYLKGQKFYSDNKEIGDLKAKIHEEEEKIFEIETFEKGQRQAEDEENRLFNAIISNHLQYKKNAQNVIDNLHFESDELTIGAKSRLRNNELNGFLDNALNVRTHDRQEYLASIESNYESETESVIRGFLTKALANEIALKNYNDIQQVSTRFLSENWFAIDYELLYQNDTFKQMSSGKQAFVVLKLLLDFSDKKNPIFIDQPEDSLDNRAIYNELVTYILRKKKQRQIILVTHNPNIVVSSDSENVIVANQQGNDSQNENGCRFQYINGALENTVKKDSTCSYVLKSQGIKEHVCEILEGGVEAFKKREQKYGLSS